MVDCTGLENRRTERYRGFESLSLRFKADFTSKSAFFVYCFFKGNLLKTSTKAIKEQKKQAMSEGSNRSGTDVKKCYFLRPLEK